MSIAVLGGICGVGVGRGSLSNSRSDMLIPCWRSASSKSERPLPQLDRYALYVESALLWSCSDWVLSACSELVCGRSTRPKTVPSYVMRLEYASSSEARIERPSEVS